MHENPRLAVSVILSLSANSNHAMIKGAPPPPPHVCCKLLKSDAWISRYEGSHNEVDAECVLVSSFLWQKGWIIRQSFFSFLSVRWSDNEISSVTKFSPDCLAEKITVICRLVGNLLSCVVICSGNVVLNESPFVYCLIDGHNKIMLNCH